MRLICLIVGDVVVLAGALLLAWIVCLATPSQVSAEADLEIGSEVEG